MIDQATKVGDQKPDDAPEDYEPEVIEDCLDLNSDQLLAALYGAVQKLQQKVEVLEIANQQLTERIEKLEML
jgi:hypothetical protein